MTDWEFRETYRAHQGVVFRYAYRMTGSVPAAEVLVQDVFVAFWRKPGSYEADRGSVRSFLLGIARNVVLKRWRKESRIESLEEDAVLSIPALDVGFADAEAVAKAVGALPALQREAVILAEYEELSLDEIALATGVEVAAVKSRLQRGRNNLRRMLAPLLEAKGSTNGLER
jgi:RNA polymerase sigma-70 factor (ECF subfamily)